MKIFSCKQRWLGLVLICLLTSAAGPASGQEATQRTVRGTVMDADQNTLPGVSILVKGTPHGVMTDVDGAFEVTVPDGNSELVFSFVGYVSQTVQVGNNTVLNVTLQPDITTLDEVVVIGYGTQSRRNVTGAVAKVEMTSTENVPNTNVTQALRGRVAGVQFTDNGRPGQNGSILIRGQRSVSASNSPLIILDGVFFNGSFVDINPNDIESMEVLKDASAAAIYGSKAANGVILITSKKGTTDKPTIRVNTFYGTSDWSKRLDLMSPERYLEKAMAIREMRGIAYDPADPSTYLTLTELDNYNAGKTIDALDMVSQQGSIMSTDLSVSGKTESVNYFVSGAYSKENGLILNDNLRRVSFRTNLDVKVAPWLRIGTNSMFSENKQLGVPAQVNRAMRQSPYGTWYHADGTPTQLTVPEDAGASPNPLWVSHYQDNENVRNNLFANAYAIVEIPGIEGLSYRLNVSSNQRTIRDYAVTRQDPNIPTNNTEASKRNWRANDYVIENILDYSTEFGRDHAVDVTLMYGSNEFTSESTTASATQLASDVLGWNNLQAGSLFTNVSSAERTSGVSSMARINYRFMDRYLLTLTARRDGSSVFATNNKFATFPSAAVSWIASEEEFLNDLSFLDMLKLRLSYGAVGNQAISPYQSLSLANTVYYVFGDGAGPSLGIYPSNISNADLKWETTYIANIGLDFSTFNGRLGGTVEVYNMKTNDLLVERSLPNMTGYTSIWTNLGEVQNKGIEITLNTINLRSNAFEWATDVILSHNKNKIVSLYGFDLDGDGKEDDDIGNSWFIGQPIDVFYDYIYDGIFQQGDDMPAGFQPGFAKFRDLDGDGNYTAANDRAIVGQGQPKLRWGLTNTFTYGNFQLSVFINSMRGWVGVFNQMDYNFDSVDPARPANMLDADFWTEDNPNAKRPSLEYKRSTLGHNWYASRDFVRIQDVSLAYNVPQGLLDRLSLSSVTLYGSAKNLATFTDWPGMNPEAITSYPIPRSFAVGIRAAF